MFTYERWICTASLYVCVVMVAYCTGRVLQVDIVRNVIFITSFKLFTSSKICTYMNVHVLLHVHVPQVVHVYVKLHVYVCVRTSMILLL